MLYLLKRFYCWKILVFFALFDIYIYIYIYIYILYLLYIYTYIYRGRFNDLWFVLHDFCWSFHEPYFSRKHTFHKSYRVNYLFNYLFTMIYSGARKAFCRIMRHKKIGFVLKYRNMPFWGMIIMCKTKYLNK